MINWMPTKVLDEIRKGNQAFIVCPLIHKSEKINAVSIEEIKDEIKIHIFLKSNMIFYMRNGY